jgi:hypothetical protein
MLGLALGRLADELAARGFDQAIISIRANMSSTLIPLTMGGPYGGIVELLALTGQRREEVARSIWDEFNLGQRIWVLDESDRPGSSLRNLRTIGRQLSRSY